MVKEQTGAEREKVEVTDVTGLKKQIWSRDLLTINFRRKILFDDLGNPIEIWIHDYVSKQTKKITITWDDEGNPIDIKDEFMKVKDWFEKWGSEP